MTRIFSKLRSCKVKKKIFIKKKLKLLRFLWHLSSPNTLRTFYIKVSRFFGRKTPTYLVVISHTYLNFKNNPEQWEICDFNAIWSREGGENGCFNYRFKICKSSPADCLVDVPTWILLYLSTSFIQNSTSITEINTFKILSSENF